MDLAVTIKSEADSETEDETSPRCSESFKVAINRRLKMAIEEKKIKEKLPTMDLGTTTNIEDAFNGSCKYTKFGIVDHSMSSMDLPDLVKVEEESYDGANADSQHSKILNVEINQQLKVEIGDTEVKSELPAWTVPKTLCTDSRKSYKATILNPTKLSGSKICHDNVSTHSVDELMNKVKCTQCEFTNANPKVVEEHALSHSLKAVVVLFPCTLCPYIAKSVASMVEHMQTHKEDKPHAYKCTRCDYATVWPAYIKSHMRKHLINKQYRCTKCNFTTKRDKFLREHMRSHVKERPFKCNLCDFTAIGRNCLAKHMQGHRRGLRPPHQCAECDYATTREERLQEHMKSHTEKPFSCTLCLYVAGRFGDLKEHMEGHIRNEIHKCTMCNFTAKHPSIVGAHMNKHTEDQYVCTRCNFTAGNMSSLKTHMRSHRADKPKKGGKCKNSTGQLQGLKRRMAPNP